MKRIVRLLALTMTLFALAPAAAEAQYRVRRGDTLSSIASAHGLSLEVIRRLNPRLRNPNRIRAGDRVRVRRARRRARARLHRVVAGETLSTIAAREGTTVDALVAANRISNPNRLSVGRRLRLPTSSGCGLVFSHLVSEDFADRVRVVARRLRMHPDHLMAVMHYETAGSFRASVRNRHSGAVGLIQFLPTTARGLGTSSRRLARMTPIAQLAWVERYLRPYAGRMRTIEDAYMAVFTPAGIGLRRGHVLYRRGQRAYARNRGHDRDRDGRTTVGEIGRNARLRLERGEALRAARCE